MNSFNARLILLIVSFAFFSSVLLSTANMYFFVKDSTSDFLEANTTIAQQMARETEQLMDNVKSLAEVLAISPTFYGMDGNKIQERLFVVQKQYRQIEEMNVMDTTGQQIAKTANNNLVNRADRPYFKAAMEGKTFFTDAYISVATNAPCIKVSTPIKNAAGQIVGVFAVDVSLKALLNISENVKIGQGGYVDIVDQNGSLLAHSNKERVKKLESVADLPYIQDVMRGKTGTTEGVSTTGIPSLVAYTPMKMLGWGMIVYQPVSELKAVIINNIMITLTMLFMVLLPCWNRQCVRCPKYVPAAQLAGEKCRQNSRGRSGAGYSCARSR